MAPKDDVLEAELAIELRLVFNSSDRDKLTVNYVRRRVEQKLGLDDGFFNDGEWKSKSKELLRDAIAKLESGEAPSSQVTASPAKPKGDATATSGTKKRVSTDRDALPRKRQKKIPAKSEAAESSDLSDANDTPKKTVKKKPTKQAIKKKAKAISDEDDELHSSDKNGDEDEPKKEVEKQPPAPAVHDSEADDSPLSDVRDFDDVNDAELQGDKKSRVEDDESELSEVIDEPPKPKRKAKNPAEKKPKKAPRPKSAGKQTTELPADEAEMKKLQGQLVKCGVRKIWAFELKKYGDDSRAKIRHLKSMLADIGMDGRFSEAKAREIKERRELEADLEAVKAMNRSWGIGSTGRASRSRAANAAKKAYEEEEDEENGEQSGKVGEAGADDDDGSDAEAKPMARGKGSAKYRAELAFLEDESESD